MKTFCTWVLLAYLLGAGASRAQPALEATTATGEKVRLFPNGRWEYAEEKKAAVQRQAAEAETARERSGQGGFLGFGRRVYEGDKDYNRGSLNPKLR
jgi:hypothetical protein